MKRFQFHLQVALDYRRRIEDKIQSEMAEIQVRKQDEERRLQRFFKLQSEGLGMMAASRQGLLKQDDFMIRELYLEKLEKQIVSQKELMELIQQELDQKIQEAVIARQKTRALEKLREKHEQAYRMEMLREDQKFLDELASIQAARLIRESA